MLADRCPLRLAQKRYGYDPSLYSAKPGQQLDNFLSEILPTLDVDLLPGERDPTGSTLPQQPLHFALLPDASRYEGFRTGPNPWWGEIAGATCVELLHICFRRSLIRELLLDVQLLRHFGAEPRRHLQVHRIGGPTPDGHQHAPMGPHRTDRAGYTLCVRKLVPLCLACKTDAMAGGHRELSVPRQGSLHLASLTPRLLCRQSTRLCDRGLPRSVSSRLLPHKPF